MANLKLKWGSYSALPKTVATDDIGAIFVTKDEGGIYLGVESGKAPKRLQGVVQYYEDLTSFQAATKPPYSSDVIYYIANSNALVRWDPAAKDGAGGFIVLNVTANEFAILNDQVQNHLTEIESKQVFDKVAKIDELEQAIDAVEELIGGGTSGEGVTSIISQIEELSNNQVEINKDLEEISRTLINMEATYETKENATTERKKLSDRIDLIDGEEGTVKKLTDRVTALDKTSGRIAAIEGALSNKVDLSHLESTYQTKLQATTDHNALSDRIDAIDNAETGALKIITDRISLIDGETGRLKAIEDNLDLKLDKVTFEDFLDTVTETYYTKSEAETLESTLREELANNIETANCLTYQGSIDEGSDFKALEQRTDLQVGYTYIITTELTLPSIGACYAGDLIIASGEETDGVLSNVSWIHVKTGYQSNHNTVLSAESGSEDENKAKINLTSLNGQGEKGDCGSVSIYGDNNMIISQLTKTTTSGSGETIITPIPEFKFSLQWLEF